MAEPRRIIRRLRLATPSPRGVPLRLGLRARIMLAFGIGALLLSSLVSLITWAITQQSLLDQREASATAQVTANAQRMASRITPDRPDPLPALAGLVRPSGSSPILFFEDSWFPLTPELGRETLPRALRETVMAGEPSRMRFRHDDALLLAVGVPIRELDGAFFEIVSLEELEDTLESLGLALLGSSLFVTLVGTGLGYFIARRVIRPLGNVGAAAEAIAGGRLSTRLEASRDPDLTPLASSFNKMATALEERIARDTQFTSNVSHEIRSPLQTLTSSISVLQHQLGDDIPDKAADALALMSAEIERFGQLVDDLLEISRFDTGVDQLHLHEVRLAELVMQAVGTSTETEVPLDIDAELAGIVVRADKRRLMRVIANLLDNAVKYGGGPTRVELRRQDSKVLIAVEDDGPGVPPTDRERIFRRFNRGSGAGRRGSVEGVGLGLSLVAQHVGIHGGRVWVEDKPDGRPGARFVVALPAEEQEEEWEE